MRNLHKIARDHLTYKTELITSAKMSSLDDKGYKLQERKIRSKVKEIFSLSEWLHTWNSPREVMEYSSLEIFKT